MSQREERIARARSFARVAGDYDRVRPSYPGEAIVWLVGTARRRVLDLGAGTGKLTAVLLELGHDVVAVEPLVEMRALLSASLPRVEALPGTAETIPLPDASVDAVTAGQAFHWFDPSRALPEIARVLRPGGVLALVWNVRDERLPWVAELSRLIGSERLSYGWTDGIEAASSFGDVERRDFSFAQELDAEQLLALVRSRSHCASKSEDERGRVLASVQQLVGTHPDLAARRTFSLPYVTQAYRVPRL